MGDSGVIETAILNRDFFRRFEIVASFSTRMSPKIQYNLFSKSFI